MASSISCNNADAQSRLTGILSVVQGISGLTSFARTFNNCDNLTGPIPAGLFDNNTLVTDFSYTFSQCTGVTSAVPTLWISHPAATHDYCFYGDTNASNYGSIPADWK